MPARAATSARFAPIWLSIVVAICIATLLAGVVLGAGDGPDAPTRGVDWVLLGRSLAVAIGIGLGATLCAWPAAWAARGLTGAWFAALLVPMLLPGYLTFIGWSQLRAPGTWLGDALMRGPAEGPNWWPVAAARVCAVGGLILWSWPLAFLILSLRVRRIGDDTLDALRLEPQSRRRQSLTLMAMCRGAIAAAVTAVALVMLGSAVPLHLAQLDTYAIELWRRLDESPAGEHWRVWAAAWPLMAIAAAAALALGMRTAAAAGASLEESHHRATGSAGGLWTLALWLLSVVAPAALMLPDLRTPFATDFWRSHGTAATVSGSIAALTGVVGLSISVAAWRWLSTRRSDHPPWVAAMPLIALVFTGLMPGVLVGSAIASAWNRLGGASDAAALAAVVLAHVTRLGFVSLLVGWWAFRNDPLEARDLRSIDGADSLGGWLRAAWPTHSGPVLAGGLAVGLLSFHEIEAAVMLQPPGYDSFPRQMLQLLHYNRLSDLTAAVVVVLLIGVLASAAILGLASWRRPSAAAVGGAYRRNQ